MDSDESDFYGEDDGIVPELEERIARFDVDEWAEGYRLNPARPRKSATRVADGSSHLHNPYAGVPYAWQLTETLDDFLTRLPPATTSQADVPWIYICNPYLPGVPKAESDGAQHKGEGNGDEAPVQRESDIRLVVEAGMERLQLARSFLEEFSTMNKSKAVVEREATKARQHAVSDILELAHAAKVRAGKWMIFCTTQEVDEVWEIVARATAANQLGIAAKVAPKPVEEIIRKDRLICVYTSDFKDKADVGRVLKKLRELKLVEAKGRAVYYKPDAFTYIGIGYGNPWGIKASLYSSWDKFPN
ncbi:unnamed protein product [Clonostachys rosea f. rosea IK726]|uniref:Uncharacterized protein n=1 Tax=Clonostachys rosea f. rosea IK726 TaxID=1349383 RepID=A0ACA9TSF7_BIOOC|nr:unnamed protein product [Clonostachys rosea f. rosea IK726]